MVQQLETNSKPQIIYPESDGQPMADNTKQFRWIVAIKENLELLFKTFVDVFIAGDLLWYPVEGDSKISAAPDVMVVFGRPKGDRGSYQQWEEDGIAPQVTFEILSPTNSPSDMEKKLRFYQRYGVEEYYLYDPNSYELQGWLRSAGVLEAIDRMDGWVSPRLGIRFDLSEGELRIFTGQGERFLSFSELAQLKEEQRQRAELAEQRAELAEQRAELAEQLASQTQAKLQQLQAQLQAMGIDPEQL